MIYKDRESGILNVVNFQTRMESKGFGQKHELYRESEEKRSALEGKALSFVRSLPFISIIHPLSNEKSPRGLIC